MTILCSKGKVACLRSSVAATIQHLFINRKVQINANGTIRCQFNMVELFISVQRRMWYILCHCGKCLYYVDLDKKDRYFIRKLNIIGEFLVYYCLYINFILKFVHHLLAYHGYWGIPVHFRDQMGGKSYNNWNNFFRVNFFKFFEYFL